MTKKAITLALAIAACSSSSTSVPTFRDFVKAQYAAMCNTRFKCCTPEQAMARQPAQPTAALCISAVDADIDMSATYTAWENAIGSGLFKYDEAAAAECVDTMITLESSASFCSDEMESLGSSPPVTASSLKACEDVLVGTLAQGAACDGNLPACAKGLYCTAGIGTTETGTCNKPAASGQACGLSTPCDSGLKCLPSGVCGAPLADGAGCTEPEQCASSDCDMTGHCVSQTVAQLYCDMSP
jgi:hypothetical protein